MAKLSSEQVQHIMELYVDTSLTAEDIAVKVGSNSSYVREAIRLCFHEEYRRKRRKRVTLVQGKNRSFNPSYAWVKKFKDMDKFSFLHDKAYISINNGTIKNADTEWYVSYIDKFYHCERFNRLYFNWLYNDKCKLLKPSLDHIVPVSKGGSDDIENIVFLTFFENKAKTNYMPDQWENIKNNIDFYLI